MPDIIQIILTILGILSTAIFGRKANTHMSKQKHFLSTLSKHSKVIKDTLREIEENVYSIEWILYGVLPGFFFLTVTIWWSAQLLGNETTASISKILDQLVSFISWLSYIYI